MNDMFDYNFISEVIMNLLKKYNKMESSRFIYRNYPLTVSEMYYILAIQSCRKISMTDLAKEVDVNLSTATSMIDKLTHKGLVERIRDSEDRRQVFVELTPKGTEIYGSIIESRKIIAEKLFSLFTPEEKIWVYHILLKLHKKLNEEEEN
jgi:MarR family 2-MHQ and catechol resistance regulon transcriptional repressor